MPTIKEGENIYEELNNLMNEVPVKGKENLLGDFNTSISQVHCDEN